MDGYALRRVDLSGPGPWVLSVCGRIRAGDAPLPLPEGGAALRVLTGAALPSGADAIVAQEDVLRDGERIVLNARPRPFQHIRRAGEDMAEGSDLLAAGRVIGPRDAALLASAGIGQVAVRRRLRISMLCTGSELVAPGRPVAPGQIWNANHYLLGAALARPWIDRRALDACPDNPEALRAAVAAAAEDTDIVLTTGGVSVGDEDHMAAAVADAGGTVKVMKLAMKPGKPVSLGRIGGALWIGLPGNPVAAFVAWHVLGARLAEAMAAIAEPELRRSAAALAAEIRHRPGRREYRPARLLGYSRRGVARILCLDAPGSHRVAQLAEADGFAVVPADVEGLGEGDIVEFQPF